MAVGVIVFQALVRVLSSAGCRRRSAGCRRRSAGCRRRSAGCRRRIVFVAAQTIRCHHCHVNPVHSKQAQETSSRASGLSRVGGPSIGHNANASSRVDGNGNDGHKVCHLDARYALRRLCHSPVLSAISVAIFAALSSQCHVKVNVSVKANDAALTACSAASLDLNASASASAIKRSTSCILRRSPWSHSSAGGGVRLRLRTIAGGCDITGGRRSDSDAGYHNQNQRQAHTDTVNAAMINQGQRQAHTPPHVCVHARSIWTPCIRTNERKTTNKQRERLHRMDRHINKPVDEIFDELTIHDRPMNP